jgi:hypothetical protein
MRNLSSYLQAPFVAVPAARAGFRPWLPSSRAPVQQYNVKMVININEEFKDYEQIA